MLLNMHGVERHWCKSKQNAPKLILALHLSLSFNLLSYAFWVFCWWAWSSFSMWFLWSEWTSRNKHYNLSLILCILGKMKEWRNSGRIDIIHKRHELNRTIFIKFHRTEFSLMTQGLSCKYTYPVTTHAFTYHCSSCMHKTLPVIICIPIVAQMK